MLSEGPTAACDPCRSSLSVGWSAGVVAHVRSRLVAEQRRVTGQQAGEHEAVCQQLKEVQAQLQLKLLWQREVGGSVGWGGRDA